MMVNILIVKKSARSLQEGRLWFFVCGCAAAVYYRRSAVMR